MRHLRRPRVQIDRQEGQDPKRRLQRSLLARRLRSPKRRLHLPKRMRTLWFLFQRPKLLQRSLQLTMVRFFLISTYTTYVSILDFLAFNLLKILYGCKTRCCSPNWKEFHKILKGFYERILNGLCLKFR